MCGQQAGAEIEITPRMLEAGEQAVEDWASIEPSFALARRVYIAMARNAPGRSQASGRHGDVPGTSSEGRGDI